MRFAFERGKTARERLCEQLTFLFHFCDCFALCLKQTMPKTNDAKDKQSFHSFHFVQSVLFVRCNARRETTGTLAKVRDSDYAYHECDGGSTLRFTP